MADYHLKLIPPKTATLTQNNLIVKETGTGGTSDYNALRNKPSINNVELKGNKTGAELNLVSKTDYATYIDKGIMSVGVGLKVNNGKVDIYPATEDNIKNKVSNRVLTPSEIDNAVKVGLTTNTEELTDEEKSNATNFIGAVKQVEYSKDRTFPTGSDGGVVGRLYMRFRDNTENSIVADCQGNLFTVPVRDSASNFYVGDPTQPYHTANKRYVDNIAASLSGQNEYIGSYQGADYTADTIQDVLSTFVIETTNPSREKRNGDIINIVNGIYGGQQWIYNGNEAVWKYYIDFQNHSVIDNLESDSSVDGLAAKQGKQLKTEIDEIKEKYLEKTTEVLRIYGTDSNGKNILWNIRNTNSTANTIAGRDSKGNIQVGTAINSSDATNKKYVDDIAKTIPTVTATKLEDGSYSLTIGV